MKTILPLLLLLAADTVPSVAEQDGNIIYTNANGTAHMLTQGGGYRDPSLSPDGHTVVFVHVDKRPDHIGMDGQTSLWIADSTNGSMRKLLAPTGKDESPTESLNFFHDPIFSLDGGFVYISAQAWVVSDAVHQINVKTGTTRFVVDGSLLSVIRTGPYRGFLLVQRHLYYPPPQYGSYNPVYVVRPDNKKSFIVPGSDKDDGEHSVEAWLQAKGWKAW